MGDYGYVFTCFREEVDDLSGVFNRKGAKDARVFVFRSKRFYFNLFLGRG